MEFGESTTGLHEVHVTVTDGKGGKAKGTVTVRTVDADGCDPPPKPCPLIKVSCAAELDQSEPFMFSAIIRYALETNAEVPSDEPITNCDRVNETRASVLL